MDIPLIDRIERWFEQSPKAQRAVKRLSADLDTLVERLEGAIPPDLRDAIAARIDPPGTTGSLSIRDAEHGVPPAPPSELPPQNTAR